MPRHRAIDPRSALDFRAIVRGARKSGSALFTLGNASYIATVTIATLIPKATVIRLEGDTPSGWEVHLSSTSPHFGGLRWWALCPVCVERVAILYLAASLACRRCLRLIHHSTRETPLCRARAELRKLRGRFGNAYDELSTRPKGMWRKTFMRHLAREDELSEREFVAFRRSIARWG